jgi:hypothetical protein
MGVGGEIHAATHGYFAGALFAGGSGVVSGNGTSSGTYYFGTAANGKYLNYDTANFNLVGSSFKIADTTASSSPTTGALTVAGGVGVSGNISVGFDAASSSVRFGDASVGPHLIGRRSSDGSLLIGGGQALIEFHGNNPLKLINTTASTSAATGALTVAGGVGVGGGIHTIGDIFVGQGTGQGVVRFGDNSNNYLWYNGTNFILNGAKLNITDATASSSPTTGALTVAGGIGIAGTMNAGNNITTGASSASASVFFGNTGTKYLNYDSVNYYLKGGSLNVQNTDGTGTLLLGNSNQGYFAWQNTQTLLQMIPGGYYWSILTAVGQLNWVANNAVAFSSNFNGDFTITGANATKPGGGAWAAASDSRIKNELGDYTRGLAEIAGLRPIYYTYKGNDTPEAPAHLKSDPLNEDSASKEPLTVPYPNSLHLNVAKAGTKYAGLIAQEVEAIIPEMVTKRSAFIDGAAVDDLRDLDTTPLIFALINAVKELKARIEVLEAT